jgi:beta-1,4-mannosyl-glycoprotein beta-1,4-N-acetylglucosaminyltransferase
MKKIYDAFLFFNELDLLEIRLSMLDAYVDFFVISECDYTFSGNKKPFYFEENKHLFSKFLHKIIHIKNYNANETENLINIQTGKRKIIFDNIIKYYNVIKNSAETDFGKSHWCLDYLHREFVSLGLSECNDDDIIIFGDLDELPNPEIIKNIKNLSLNQNKYTLYQNYHNYFINILFNLEWMGNVIVKYQTAKLDSLANLRRNRSSYIKLENGGWHLSFMGGIDRIKHKLECYGHQEFNNDFIKSNIEVKINQNSDLFNRNIVSKIIDIDNYYPYNITQLIKNKYPYLIK